MAKRSALVFLSLAAPVILALFWLPLPFAGELFALLAGAFPVALIVVGASREGRLGPLLLPVLALTVILEGAIAAMLWLRGQVADGPWVLGLPLSAAVMIYGLFLLPLPLVGLAYALTFRQFTLRDSDLRALGLESSANREVDG